MTKERDPRVNPMPGDVLGKRGNRRTVVDVRSGIIRSGTFVTSLSHRKNAAEVVWDGPRWRAWAKTATIIKRGDQQKEPES